MARNALFLVLLAGIAGPAVAQQDEAFHEIDRIVAVVGTTPITLSRLTEEVTLFLAEYQRTGRPAPSTPDEMDALRHEVLDRLIADELLIQMAQRDTLVSVPDQQVQVAADAALRQTRSQFASEQEYRRQLAEAGLGTPEEYRRYMMEQTRRGMLRQALLENLRARGELRQIPPTEDELRQYFEDTREQQPPRPASVTLRQIVVRPAASPAADSVARMRADSVARAIRNGADFATAARRFSGDPGTREQGGELGWFRRGNMARQFEAAAFRLRPGQISNPVRSPFGYHVIEVQRIEPGEIRARHILFDPEITEADRDAARARADSAAVALRAGAPVDSVTRLYHDEVDQQLFERVARTDLPAAYRDALEGHAPGDVVGPIEVTENGPPRFAVIQFLEEVPEGQYTFEELRDRLRANLSEGSGVRRLIDELRATTYVDLRL